MGDLLAVLAYVVSHLTVTRKAQLATTCTVALRADI